MVEEVVVVVVAILVIPIGVPVTFPATPSVSLDILAASELAFSS